MCLSGRGDTWSTYVRPSGSHLPFYVRRTLIGYTEKILRWVDLFSFSGADLTGQCHSQFEMDRINICGVYETIRVIQGQHGLPQFRFKTNESTVLVSKWRSFLHFTWKYKQKQDKELSGLGNILVCLSFSLETVHCLRFEILFLLSRSLSKVDDARWTYSLVSVWNAPFERFTLIWNLQIWNTDFVSNY